MNIFLHKDKNIKETMVDITYRIFDWRVQKIVDLFEESSVQIEGTNEGRTYIIESTDVYYIESVDNSTFLYTETDVFENREKLYHFEQNLKKKSFVQINKSTLLNMNYLDYVSPLPNHRLEAHLKNSDRLVINRHSMKYVKEYLNI